MTFKGTPCPPYISYSIYHCALSRVSLKRSSGHRKLGRGPHFLAAGCLLPWAWRSWGKPPSQGAGITHPLLLHPPGSLSQETELGIPGGPSNTPSSHQNQFLQQSQAFWALPFLLPPCNLERNLSSVLIFWHHDLWPRKRFPLPPPFAHSPSPKCTHRFTCAPFPPPAPLSTTHKASRPGHPSALRGLPSPAEGPEPGAGWGAGRSGLNSPLPPLAT